jgi:hypothetical protein
VPLGADAAGSPRAERPRLVEAAIQLCAPDRLAGPVRARSYALPATYAIRTFQDEMLLDV